MFAIGLRRPSRVVVCKEAVTWQCPRRWEVLKTYFMEIPFGFRYINEERKVLCSCSRKMSSCCECLTGVGVGQKLEFSKKNYVNNGRAEKD